MRSPDEELPFLISTRNDLSPNSNHQGQAVKPVMSAWRFDEIWERLDDEWKLYNYHMLGVVFWTNLFVLWFFTLGILRNIAYWRHVPGPNLPDLAFDFIEENNNEMVKKIIEICFFSSVVGLVLVFFIGSVIYQPPHMPRVYATGLIVKGVCGYHMGLFLRAFIFLSTSIPGSASHCHPDIDPMYWVRKPKFLWECFTFTNLSYPNCGDLIFSGHVFSTVFLINMLESATSSTFGYHPRLHKWIFRLLYLGIICQTYEILAVRNHYFADVLLAFIFTPLFIHWWDKIKVFDVNPRESVMKIEDEGEQPRQGIETTRSLLDYCRSRSLIHAVFALAQMGFILYMVKRALARLKKD